MAIDVDLPPRRVAEMTKAGFWHGKILTDYLDQCLLDVPDKLALVDSANGLHVDLYISNLMNRLAQLSRYTESNPSLDNEVYIVPAQPRTFGIEFGQDF